MLGPRFQCAKVRPAPPIRLTFIQERPRLRFGEGWHWLVEPGRFEIVHIQIFSHRYQVARLLLAAKFELILGYHGDSSHLMHGLLWQRLSFTCPAIPVFIIENEFFNFIS
jgi:hypothetical protein